MSPDLAQLPGLLAAHPEQALVKLPRIDVENIASHDLGVDLSCDPKASSEITANVADGCFSGFFSVVGMWLKSAIENANVVIGRMESDLTRSSGAIEWFEEVLEQGKENVGIVTPSRLQRPQQPGEKVHLMDNPVCVRLEPPGGCLILQGNVGQQCAPSPKPKVVKVQVDPQQSGSAAKPVVPKPSVVVKDNRLEQLLNTRKVLAEQIERAAPLWRQKVSSAAAAHQQELSGLELQHKRARAASEMDMSRLTGKKERKKERKKTDLALAEMKRQRKVMLRRQEQALLVLRRQAKLELAPMNQRMDRMNQSIKQLK